MSVGSFSNSESEQIAKQFGPGPLPPGKPILAPIQVSQMSHDEKAMLEAIGLGSEDKVPGELSEIIHKNVQKINLQMQEVPNYEAMGLKPIKIDPKDISELPAEVRQRLMKDIRADLQEFRAQEKQSNTQFHSPAVQQAAESALAGLSKSDFFSNPAEPSATPGTVNIVATDQKSVDQILAEIAQGPVSTHPDFSENSVLDRPEEPTPVQPQPQPQPQSQPQPQPQSQPPQTQPERTDIQPEQKSAICKQCGWNQLNDPPDEPTRMDYENYLIAISTGLPFSKVFTLYDGRVRITFEEPSIEEQNRLSAHVGNLLRSKGLTPPTVAGQFWSSSCFSVVYLKSISRYNNKNELLETVPVDQLKKHSQFYTTAEIGGQSTKPVFDFQEYIAYVENQVLKTPSFREMIRMAFVKYQNISQRLGDKAFAGFSNPTRT